MDTTAPGPRVLVIGLDPYRVPGPWDPAPVADAIAVGMARFADAGVGAESCLFGLDGSDDVEAVVTEALDGRPWEVVVVGGGVRKPDDQLTCSNASSTSYTGTHPMPRSRSTARPETLSTPRHAGWGPLDGGVLAEVALPHRSRTRRGVQARETQIIMHRGARAR